MLTFLCIVPLTLAKNVFGFIKKLKNQLLPGTYLRGQAFLSRNLVLF
jgi:hypothetical protein